MYEAREDSYLLSNTLRDRDVNGETAVEIGVGSGVVTRVLAERYNDVFGVDIDDDAITHCQDAFKDDDNVTIKHSDRFTNVPGRLAPVDLIACNPPYLPSNPSVSDPAVDGGASGIEYTQRFLDEAKAFTDENTDVYLVASDKADLDALHDHLDKTWEYDQVNDASYFFETIIVYHARRLH